MGRYSVRIEPLEDDYYWSTDEWQSNIHPYFDEVAVITGNDDFAVVENARWWKDAKELVESLDGECYGDTSRFITYFSEEDEYATDKLEDVAEAYDNASKIDTDFILKVAEILYPWISLEHTTIRGNSQGEWAELIYEDGEIDPSIAEDWYFGKVYEALLADNETDPDGIEASAIITDTEYWRAYHNLEGYFAEMFGIPADEVTVIEE